MTLTLQESGQFHLYTNDLGTTIQMRHIYLFSDFGSQGPYVGQMRARLAALPPDAFTVIDLMHDAPVQDPRSASYLLAALAADMPADAICVAVVDPGVGTRRDPLVVQADSRLWIGPDNGLLAIPARRARKAVWRRIDWRPDTLSNSFHGRDLFAPAAGHIAREGQGWLDRWTTPLGGGGTGKDRGWPDDLPAVIYIDQFGNAMTGLRAPTVSRTAGITVGDAALPHAETFGAVPPGAGFVEIAVNRGEAANVLGVRIGTPVALRDAADPAG